ncbi:hypothetical protein CWI47_09260, partial [Neisseria meningitidis]|uniref:hypothetical protein n=1 Tax=Neisseria meningitidis TaxID=487 RepID=UPI000CAB0D70
LKRKLNRLDRDFGGFGGEGAGSGFEWGGKGGGAHKQKGVWPFQIFQKVVDAGHDVSSRNWYNEPIDQNAALGAGCLLCKLKNP